MSPINREVWFLFRDRSALLWLGLAFLSAAISVFLGLQEVSTQRATIAKLIEADRIEREIVAEGQSDWGSAAYYSFHLTYDEPSEFAFAALGHRDMAPWKHRIRMLALEGQIYETDTSNPDFALIGRFDFAFVVSLLAPLFLILILHDSRSRELAAGRLNLLEATSQGQNLWYYRSSLRTLFLWIVLVVPLIIGGLLEGSSWTTLIMASLAVLAHLVFWWLVGAFVSQKKWISSINLISLLGVWILLAIVAPVAIKAGVNSAVSVPDGGDILLTQREAVNDAWDLPKEATFDPFAERHPELAEHAKTDSTFEWKWYYAFQQVGDQKAEELSKAYFDGRMERDRIAGAVSWLTPPILVQRLFQTLALTDQTSALAYESQIRAYHGELRAFYYELMFPDVPFDPSKLAERPNFRPVETSY